MRCARKGCKRNPTRELAYSMDEQGNLRTEFLCLLHALMATRTRRRV